MSICLVTTYVPDPSLKYHELVMVNHQRYASRHGYQHVAIAKRMVADNETDHWNKIVAVNRILNSVEHLPGSPDWIIWLDSDAVVLDLDVNIQDIILHYLALNPHLKASFIEINLKALFCFLIMRR